jgi:hypothetical protein
MNVIPNKGALVYLPSGVRLYKLSDGHVVLRYKTVSKPTNVLIVDQKEHGYCKVLYEGESWHVPAEDLYPTRFLK